MMRALSVVVAFLCLFEASARPQVDLSAYSFEKFVSDFKLSYSAGELADRKALFEAELGRVKAHNSNPASKWKEGINKFSAMTAAEKKAYAGRSKGVFAAQARDGLKARKEHVAAANSAAISASVDWRDAGIVSAVKDQGHCGSCWAFASTATIESYVAKNTGLLFDLSVEQIAMCAPNPNSCGGSGGCNGATAEIAFDYLANSGGIFQEYQYSYNSYYGQNFDCAIPETTNPVATISGFTQLPANNYTALLHAIATEGPIAISVDASSWHAYEGGIFNGCNQVNPDINHAVVLVGFGEENGEKYWLVRNSWSAAWGEKGYIRLHRSDNEEGNCGSDITPQDGTACAGETDPVKACGTCGILFDSSYPTGATTL